MEKVYSGYYTVYYDIKAEDEDDLKEQIYSSLTQGSGTIRCDVHNIEIDEVNTYDGWEDVYGN